MKKSWNKYIYSKYPYQLSDRNSPCIIKNRGEIQAKLSQIQQNLPRFLKDDEL
jgi:hypothetical protein